MIGIDSYVASGFLGSKALDQASRGLERTGVFRISDLSLVLGDPFRQGQSVPHKPLMLEESPQGSLVEVFRQVVDGQRNVGLQSKGCFKGECRRICYSRIGDVRERSKSGIEVAARGLSVSSSLGGCWPVDRGYDLIGDDC